MKITTTVISEYTVDEKANFENGEATRARIKTIGENVLRYKLSALPTHIEEMPAFLQRKKCEANDSGFRADLKPQKIREIRFAAFLMAAALQLVSK